MQYNRCIIYNPAPFSMEMKCVRQNAFHGIAVYAQSECSGQMSKVCLPLRPFYRTLTRTAPASVWAGPSAFLAIADNTPRPPHQLLCCCSTPRLCPSIVDIAETKRKPRKYFLTRHSLDPSLFFFFFCLSLSMR